MDAEGGGPAAGQGRRQRERSKYGTPLAVLVSMAQDAGNVIDLVTACTAFDVERQTICQAVHRLRKDGFRIETIREPGTHGKVAFYKLDEQDVQWVLEALPDVPGKPPDIGADNGPW